MPGMCTETGVQLGIALTLSVKQFRSHGTVSACKGVRTKHWPYMSASDSAAMSCYEWSAAYVRQRDMLLSLLKHGRTWYPEQTEINDAIVENITLSLP
jgi:hypothetical protein